MKYLALIFLLPLCGCSSVPTEPPPRAELAWDLEPAGSLAILINGQRQSIFTHILPYQYRELSHSEFADYGIPANAPLAVMSWYAGAGDVVYAAQKKDRVILYQREMDEMERLASPVKRIFEFRIPN